MQELSITFTFILLLYSSTTAILEFPTKSCLFRTWLPPRHYRELWVKPIYLSFLFCVWQMFICVSCTSRRSSSWWIFVLSRLGRVWTHQCEKNFLDEGFCAQDQELSADISLISYFLVLYGSKRFFNFPPCGWILWHTTQLLESRECQRPFALLQILAPSSDGVVLLSNLMPSHDFRLSSTPSDGIDKVWEISLWGKWALLAFKHCSALIAVNAWSQGQETSMVLWSRAHRRRMLTRKFYLFKSHMYYFLNGKDLNKFETPLQKLF